MTDETTLYGLVDLERYPLCDDGAFASVLGRCRAHLEASSFACLPGFLRPGVAEAMTKEVLDAIRVLTGGNNPLARTTSRHWSNSPAVMCGGVSTKAANSWSQPTCCPRPVSCGRFMRTRP